MSEKLLASAGMRAFEEEQCCLIWKHATSEDPSSEAAGRSPYISSFKGQPVSHLSLMQRKL